MRARDRELGLRMLGFHQKLYELSGGLVGERWGNLRMLLLHSTGRKTGQPRTAALLFRKDGSNYVVVGSKGGSDSSPGWLLNVEANPRVEVQVGTRRFPAKARIASPAEHRRLWPLMTETWPDYERYQSQTKRRIPLVLLEPT